MNRHNETLTGHWNQSAFLEVEKANERYRKAVLLFRALKKAQDISNAGFPGTRIDQTAISAADRIQQAAYEDRERLLSPLEFADAVSNVVDITPLLPGSHEESAKEPRPGLSVAIS